MLDNPTQKERKKRNINKQRINKARSPVDIITKEKKDGCSL